MQNTELKAGRLVTFSCGEYSDYSYQGTYVPLRDVSKDQMQEFCDSIKSESDEDYSCDPHSMFIAKLISEGCLVVVDMQEIHIGSYGDLELK